MKVSANDLTIAIAWLEANEGDDGESDACLRVAEFLRKEAQNRTVKALAREHSISPSMARKVLERLK